MSCIPPATPSKQAFRMKNDFHNKGYAARWGMWEGTPTCTRPPVNNHSGSNAFTFNFLFFCSIYYVTVKIIESDCHIGLCTYKLSRFHWKLMKDSPTEIWSVTFHGKATYKFSIQYHDLFFFFFIGKEDGKLSTTGHRTTLFQTLDYVNHNSRLGLQVIR